MLWLREGLPTPHNKGEERAASVPLAESASKMLAARLVRLALLKNSVLML
jgi:hypothetical protein